MQLALAALEACLQDERWVRMGGKPIEKEGGGRTCRCPGVWALGTTCKSNEQWEGERRVRPRVSDT